MRQGTQNKRLRSRSRKSPSPLSRVYESSGPDVKIRGSAQQVADKYVQLSRDAQSAGDRVMAENYLQHAEHYYRILAAAQPQSVYREDRDEREDRDDDQDYAQQDGREGESRDIRDDGRGNRREQEARGESRRGDRDRDRGEQPSMNGNGHAAAEGANGVHAANGHAAVANGHASESPDETVEAAPAAEEPADEPTEAMLPGFDQGQEVSAEATGDQAEEGEGSGRKTTRRRTRSTGTSTRTRTTRTSRSRRSGAGDGDTQKTDA